MAEFQIKIQINSEESLYNPFDPEQQTLGNDIIDYISDCYTEKHFREKACLVFSGAVIDPNRLHSALQCYVRHEIERNDREKKRNCAKMLRLLLIGIAFIVAGILLNTRLDSLLNELISIIGSFAVWEAANIWIVENPVLNLRKQFLKRLMETEIIIE